MNKQKMGHFYKTPYFAGAIVYTYYIYLTFVKIKDVNATFTFLNELRTIHKRMALLSNFEIFRTNIL